MEKHLLERPVLATLVRLPETAAPDWGGVLWWLLPPGDDLPDDLPARAQWQAVLARRGVAPASLDAHPQTIDLPEGGRMVLSRVPGAASRFSTLQGFRQAAGLALAERSRELHLTVRADLQSAQDALYVLWLNGVSLPNARRERLPGLTLIRYQGPGCAEDFREAQATAEANTLSRWLTQLPPNYLTPAHYRALIRDLSREAGWALKTLDYDQLKKLGCGAFCVVAQGSAQPESAAVLHLSYRPALSQSPASLALVGKGICFDTGGHNLKPARGMLGMHQDMNGSAVALGLLWAITRLEWPVTVDVWLPIARNDLSPAAFVQGDVVTALNGTTIEIIHTDAEGRLVLADALTLATRGKGAAVPDLVLDFATLTGSMKTALGHRYAGIFASDAALQAQAVAAGSASGERVVAFPVDEDGDGALASRVADIKQCTPDSEADHLLATRFLSRFIQSPRWLHMDLSSATCEGGLGGVGTEVTGFGVAWGLEVIRGEMG